jgi:electron transport complex protein RnfD
MSKVDILSSPHKHDGSTVVGVMQKVCMALLPGLACYVWFFGGGVLFQCLLSVVFALVVEAVLLKIRGREVSLYLKDGSAVVTALLFALMITPLAPWWISLAGVSFGLTFAKHMYGGLGHNLFNPAATAYVFVLLCFPAVMNNWPIPAGIQTNVVENSDVIDTLSGATPLANMQNRLASMDMISEIRSDTLYGSIAGRGWEWINLAWMAGGIALITLGLISWRIPVTMLGSMFVISMFFNLYNPDAYASPLFHLFSGGTMLGAFFIATDPVTAAATPRGKIIYGCMIGITAYVIRIWGAYPDGVAFAVLIANALVPFLDKYTRPHVLGER